MRSSKCDLHDSPLCSCHSAHTQNSKDEALGAASLTSPNKSAHPSKSTKGFDDDDDCDDEESLPNIKANVSTTKEMTIKLDRKDEEEAEIVIDLRKAHEEGTKRRLTILVTF